MKRLVVAIPALAILAGLFLFLWQRGLPTPQARPKTSSPAAPGAGAPFPASPPAHEPAAAPPSTASKASVLIRVSGKGTPLAEADVTLLREDAPGRMSFRTGHDGSRLIQQIPAGIYTAHVTHPRFLTKETQISVPGDLRTELTIDLQSGGRIRGRVTDRGTVPVHYVMVSLVDPESNVTMGPHLSAKTDVDGRYELPPVPIGTFALRFVHEKFKTLDRTGFEIRTGHEEILADATLEVGARILGRVVDEQGAPIEGAELIVGNPNGGKIAKTDVEGRFGVYGLTNEPVNGTASKKGYGTAYRRAIPANSKGVEFKLARGGVVSGHIVAEPMPEHFVVSMARYDEELGRPLRIATRSLTNAPGGAFLLDDLAPGLWWVEVEADDYEATERPQVTVASGQTAAGVTIRLRKK